MTLSSKKHRHLKAYLILCLGIGAFASVPSMHAQNVSKISHNDESATIKGVVTDSSGEPIVGASVIEIGTANGAATDINGEFQIKASRNARIRISYIGYATQEVEAVAGKQLDIVLKESGLALDDVVVVGYGTQRKVDLTGSVVRADLNSLKHSPNSNILQSLQGTVPGLNLGITTTAGGTPDISIRGNNTLNGSRDILVVLDGIIYTNSLSSLNQSTF